MPSLTPAQVLRKLALAYRLRCARDDARSRQISTPIGVWACHLCREVSLTHLAFNKHLASVHN